MWHHWEVVYVVLVHGLHALRNNLANEKLAWEWGYNNIFSLGGCWSHAYTAAWIRHCIHIYTHIIFLLGAARAVEECEEAGCVNKTSSAYEFRGKLKQTCSCVELTLSWVMYKLNSRCMDNVRNCMCMCCSGVARGWQRGQMPPLFLDLYYILCSSYCIWLSCWALPFFGIWQAKRFSL